MKCSLPTDGDFSPLSNNIDTTAAQKICNEFNVDYREMGTGFKYVRDTEKTVLRVVN